MHHVTRAAFKSLSSLFAPGMFGIFILSVLITIAALVGFVSLVTLGAGLFFDEAGMAALSGFALSSVVAWFLFPGIMPVIVNFFDVKIARAIEAKDYPAIIPASEPPFWPELMHDARFSLMAIGLNLLILPFLVIPPFYFVVFYVLNGYLLGREFFVMVARRHVPLPHAIALRKRHAGMVLAGGIGIAFCATLPLFNLVAPFWGIAMMTHLYHALSGNKPSEILLP